MSSLLVDTRIRLSVLPARLIAEALVDQPLGVDELVAEVRGDAVLLRPEVADRIIAAARAQWVRLDVDVPRLDFELEPQDPTRDFWCWAAVIASLLRYYRPAGTWSQCGVVDDNLGTDCCGGDPPEVCDVTYQLVDALTKAKLLFHRYVGSVDIGVIKDEIDREYPLCLRVEWCDPEDLGHFVVVDGYLRLAAGDFVSVSDPWYGQTDMALATLTAGSYQNEEHGCGTWTHTYATKPPPDRDLLISAVLWQAVLLQLPHRDGGDI